MSHGLCTGCFPAERARRHPPADPELREQLRSERLSPEVFRSLLSAEDLADIEGEHYPPATLRAYAEIMAESVRSGRIRVLAGRTA